MEGSINTAETEGITRASAVYVVDTNFAISHLDVLDALAQYNRDFGIVLLFPTTVIRELDLLKADSVHARKANDWLFRALQQSHPGIRGQKSSERLSDSRGDDGILDACRYFSEVCRQQVFLFSNDKNLCVKVLIYGLKTVSFVPGLTAAEIISTTLNVPLDLFYDVPMDVDVVSRRPPSALPSKHESIRLPFWSYRGQRWFPDPNLSLSYITNSSEAGGEGMEDVRFASKGIEQSDSRLGLLASKYAPSRTG